MNEIVATYTLKRPIRMGDEPITVLNFSEPTLEVLEAVERASKTSAINGILKMISMTANLPVTVVSGIKAVDLEGIMESLRPFLPEEDGLRKRAAAALLSNTDTDELRQN